MLKSDRSAEEVAQELSRDIDADFNREDPFRLTRSSIQDKSLRYYPPHELGLAADLQETYGFDKLRATVVQSPVLEHVADAAAEKLRWQICLANRTKADNTVHVGLAGGRMLRLVAERLAEHLTERSEDNPKKIVFHAMVAGFDESDFENDPNSFMNCFDNKNGPINYTVRSIDAPGIVETEFRPMLLSKFRAIRETFEAANQLDIIVSGAGDWADRHSKTQRYLSEWNPDDVEKLKRDGAICDLMWQPFSQHGPINMDNGDYEFRPNTLVDLADLPKMIARNVRVVLVLGHCARCERTKGRVLHSLLRMPKSERLISDIVTSSATVHDALDRAEGRTA